MSKMSLTEKAVRQMKAVAEFLDEYAEVLVGNIDDCYICENGITVSFNVLPQGSINTIRVTKKFPAVWKDDIHKYEDILP